MRPLALILGMMLWSTGCAHYEQGPNPQLEAAKEQASIGRAPAEPGNAPGVPGTGAVARPPGRENGQGANGRNIFVNPPVPAK